MNLSIEAEALGLKLDFPEDKTPTVTEHPVQTEKPLLELFKHAVPSRMMCTHIEVAQQYKKIIQISTPNILTELFKTNLLHLGHFIENINMPVVIHNTEKPINTN